MDFEEHFWGPIKMPKLIISEFKDYSNKNKQNLKKKIIAENNTNEPN